LVVIPLEGSAENTLDSIDGWKFSPDVENVGLEEKWFSRECEDEKWSVIKAGTRWEDQGYPDLDGHGWYRKWVDVPSDWKDQQAWIAFGGVNDSYVLYCNGKRVGSYGDKSGYSTARFPTMVELTDYLEPGQKNLIAIDVYDWTLSGGLWKLPCLLTTDPAQLPVVIVLSCWPEYEDNELTAQAVITGLGSNRPAGSMQFDLRRKGGSEILARRMENIPPDKSMIWTTFPIPRTNEDVCYEVSSKGVDREGKAIAGTVDATSTIAFGVPDYPPEYNGLKVLNNFVCELLDTNLRGTGENEFTFRNPREGWVFVGIAASGASRQPEAVLDEEASPLVWRPNPETGDLEAMRKLPAGEHRIVVRNCADEMNLTVRSVPLLGLCRFPNGDCPVSAYGSYGWEYLERYVLSNVNSIVTSSQTLPKDRFEEWLREGRAWIDQLHLAGLNPNEKVTGDDVYGKWKDEPGVVDPRYCGIIIDEFINSGNEDQYEAWTAGQQLLSADPNFSRKILYAWCGLMADFVATLDFRRAIVENGHRFVWEQYMQEWSNDEEARSNLIRRFVQHSLKWKADDSRVNPHIIQCLGIFTIPPGTLDHDPSTDFNVYLDKQFRILATEPALWGQDGVLPWITTAADEEVMRWTHRLIRHYCIEGNRNLLSTDPYVLPHLENPDFEDGLEGWTIEPASENSIEPGFMTGFGYMQRGYPRSPNGDHFVWMKHSEKKPNRLRQTVKDLEPGRLYSLKLISGDLAHPDQEPVSPPSICLENVEVVEDLGFRHVFRAGGSCKDESTGNAYSSPYMNYHRIVFRPKGRSSELVISDWKSETESGAPEGQELVCNFVQLQPYTPAPE
jgi:hypothetical protein